MTSSSTHIAVSAKDPVPVAIFDLVDTLVKRAYVFDWAEHLADKRLLKRENYLSLIESLGDYRAGKSGYEGMVVSVIDSLYRGLHGQAKSDVDAETEAFCVTGRLRNYLFRSSRDIFSMVANRYDSRIAISGLPIELVKGMEKDFPFTSSMASECDIVDGRYDALYTEEEIVANRPWRNPKVRPLSGNAEKLRAVDFYDLKEPIKWPKSFAAGNSWQDFLFMRKVPHPLLFNVHNKDKLRALALKNKWEMVEADFEDPKYNIDVVYRTLEKLF